MSNLNSTSVLAATKAISTRNFELSGINFIVKKMSHPDDVEAEEERECRERRVFVTVTRGELTWDDLSLWLESRENGGGPVKLVDGEDEDDVKDTFLIEFQFKECKPTFHR